MRPKTPETHEVENAEKRQTRANGVRKSGGNGEADGGAIRREEDAKQCKDAKERVMRENGGAYSNGQESRRMSLWDEKIPERDAMKRRKTRKKREAEGSVDASKRLHERDAGGRKEP